MNGTKNKRGIRRMPEISQRYNRCISEHSQRVSRNEKSKSSDGLKAKKKKGTHL
jgi:hypothetical protein